MFDADERFLLYIDFWVFLKWLKMIKREFERGAVKEHGLIHMQM